MIVEVVQLPVTHIEVVRKGEKGDSAYQQWLDAGHEGTEEDFFSYKYIDNTDFELIFLTSLL